MTGLVKSPNLPEHHALKLARFRLMAKAQLVNLGRAIEERRSELGLSQTRLAQRFPVDPKTISRWENGENPGAYNNLEVVAQHLETTANALQARAVAFGREDDQANLESSEESEVVAALRDRIDELEIVAAGRHTELLTRLAQVHASIEALRKPEQQPDSDQTRGSNG